MGGRGAAGGPEASAVYFPGTGRERFRGAVPPGAFDWFSSSTARYGGIPGVGGLGRLRMQDIPREWIGDPRYGAFLQWLQEQGVVDTPGPTYEVTPPGGREPEAPVPPPFGGGPEVPPGEPAPGGPTLGPGAPEPPTGGEPAPSGPPGGPPGAPGGPDAGGPGGFFGDVSPGIIPGEPGEGQESTRGAPYGELTEQEKQQLEEEEESEKFFA